MKTDVKQWALALIDTSRDEFTTLIASIPQDQRKTVGKLKQWSPKDELAHLTFWIEVFVSNIKASREGRSLLNTSNYLVMNDEAWEERKNWTWADVEKALAKALVDVKKQIEDLSSETLTESQRFSLEPDRTSPRPLLQNLTYELIDHPLHHFTKLYQKFGDEAKTTELLTRVLKVLKQPGVSKWSVTSRNKIGKHVNRIKTRTRDCMFLGNGPLPC
jgi:hypothetical protein